jgi:hypothetical protein
MKLLVFAQNEFPQRDSLLAAVNPLVSRNNLEVFTTTQNLVDRLLKNKNDFSIVILLAPTKDDLRTLVQIRNLIWETRFFLLLSDQNHEIASLSQRLFPTFISYAGKDHQELVSVLLKLMKIRSEAPGHQGTEI